MAKPMRPVGMKATHATHATRMNIREPHGYGGLRTRAGWWMEREQDARNSGAGAIGNRGMTGGETASSAGERGERERPDAAIAPATSSR